MPYNAKIYVAGHTGLVGSALVRQLRAQGYQNIITRSSAELDLTQQASVQSFFADQAPDYVFLAAAKVGGILANATYPADFIYKNLMIESNIIHAAYQSGVKKLIFLGSSCIYPRMCPQPIKEDYLLTSELEPTNEWYAVAKIAGIKLCQAYNQQHGTQFISCMPTNLYGPEDNFDLHNSHVVPALIKKIVHAQQHNEPTVVIWGTGHVYREFLYVDDCADAIIFLMNHYTGNEIVNIGTGQDCTIQALAETIKAAVGYTGTFVYDRSKPDGTPRKLLDVSRINALGWQAQTSLHAGIAQTVAWGNTHNIW